MLFLLGLNHRSASVEFREKLHFSSEEVRDALPQLLRSPGVKEALILSTCNRTEILVSAEGKESASRAVMEMLGRYRPGAADGLQRSAYRLEDAAAVKHVFRVASSLDSMILGEPQILGQVKEAYALANGASSVGPVLSGLLQRAFSCAKHVRAGTRISRHPVSVAYAAAELADQIFGSLEGRSILVLGAGKMGKLAAKHLAGKGVGRVLVASRTFDNALRVAEELGGEAIPYDEYKGRMNEVDVLIASTAAPLYIIKKDDGATMMKARKNRPLFMVDLAVPRNLDPALNEMNNLFLYNIDALQEVADEGMEERKKEARAAEAMVDQELESYHRWVQSLAVQPTIVELRKHFLEVARAELERQRQRLGTLQPEQERVVSGLLNSIMNKLLHSPTVKLKRALQARDGAELVAHTRQLFDLGEAEPSGNSSGRPAPEADGAGDAASPPAGDGPAKAARG